jgi:hypothetical protein
MFIHKLHCTTSGSGGRTCIGINKNHRTAKNHKRVIGSGLTSELYNNGKIQRKSDLLKNLKITQPRVPKKYIAFE